MLDNDEAQWLEYQFANLHEHITRLTEITLRSIRMAVLNGTQDEIDALTEAFTTLDATINSDAQSLKAEIEGLQAANPSLDLTGLKLIAAKARADLNTISALVPVAVVPDVPAPAPDVIPATTPDVTPAPVVTDTPVVDTPVVTDAPVTDTKSSDTSTSTDNVTTSKPSA